MTDLAKYTDNYISININHVVKQARETNQDVKSVLNETFGQDIDITSTRLTYGLRYWFVCPSCKERKGILYLTSDRPFCRTCLGLKYKNQRLHRNQYYENVIRPLKKTIRIENKLNGKLRHSTRTELFKRYNEILKEYNRNKLNL